MVQEVEGGSGGVGCGGVGGALYLQLTDFAEMRKCKNVCHVQSNV